MDKLLLKLVALFKVFFTKQDIDYPRMMTIVETKLMMDKRRVYMNWKQRQQKKENANHLNGVLFFYALMGLFMGFVLFAMPSMNVAMIIMHGYILFMMSMTLITDFSTVLLDTTDNQVILPRPVNSKTLFMARLVHILIYLLQFTIALALIPVAATFYNYGIVAGLVLMVTVLLTVLLAVFTTYLLYLLIIRFSSENKVKDIVNYFQIFMTIVFTLGMQVLPRMIGFSKLLGSFSLHWYSYLLPPVWMALTVEAFSTLNFDALHLSMIGLAIVLPVFTFWLMNKYLAPSFARKLSAMNAGDGEKRITTSLQSVKKQAEISKKLASIVCASAAEKTSFQLTWKLTGRDKSFKLQFYPGLAYTVVIIFIIVYKSGEDLETLWQNLSAGNSYIWFLYVPMMTVSSAIMLTAFNENYQASWVYHSMPVQKPGELISGSMKALFIKFFVPVFLVLLCFSFFTWGWVIADDALFALLNNLLCFLVVANMSEHYLPFSRQPNTQQQSGKFLKTMLQMIIVGLMVGIHFALVYIKISWLLMILIPVVAVGIRYLIKRLQQLQWVEIAV